MTTMAAEQSVFAGNKPEDGKLTGIRGWLLLVAAQLLVAPVIVWDSSREFVFDLLLNGAFSFAGSGASGFMILYGGGLYLLAIPLALIALVELLKKGRLFQLFYIFFIAVFPLAVLMTLGGSIFGGAGPEQVATLSLKLVQTTIFSTLWVLYALRSKRVKFTFVN